MAPAIETATKLDEVYHKIAQRIIPFLALVFLMNWFDCYNLGFAKLRMVQDLGFSETVYGFGPGILYLGYILFDVLTVSEDDAHRHGSRWRNRAQQLARRTLRLDRPGRGRPVRRRHR